VQLKYLTTYSCQFERTEFRITVDKMLSVSCILPSFLPTIILNTTRAHRHLVNMTNVIMIIKQQRTHCQFVLFLIVTFSYSVLD